MPDHLTVRLAWHDNNWNGTICQEPDKNYYCNGPNSLLSARIKKNKDEVKGCIPENKGKKLAIF